jgi:hypothetical protein
MSRDIHIESLLGPLVGDKLSTVVQVGRGQIIWIPHVLDQEVGWLLRVEDVPIELAEEVDEWRLEALEQVLEVRGIDLFGLSIRTEKDKHAMKKWFTVMIGKDFRPVL